VARNFRNGFSAIMTCQGGCFDCGRSWEGKNTLAVAARHYDATGHNTWVDTITTTRYGFYGRDEAAERRDATSVGRRL
jgi:hypothetical protein